MVQVLNDEHGDQYFPNLDTQSFILCAHEGLYLKVPLDRLEEDLNFPEILLIIRYVGGR